MRAVFACLLLVVGASGAVAGAPVEGSAAAGSPVSGASVDAATADRSAAPADGLFQQGTPVDERNNSTVRHEDPDAADGQGDTERVRSFLASSLGERLEGSVINLSQGEYDRAREVLGDDYDEDLDKFVDVAGETEGGSGGDAFESAAERQREYVNRTQSYRETRSEYEEAVEAGNETRARELARELARTADAVNRTGENLTASYDAIENATGADMSREEQTVREISANISADAAEVTESTLVSTRLSLSADRESTSFLDPLELAGRLTTENGSAVSNRSIALSVGERTVQVRTGENGSFSTTYRPTTVPLDRDRLAVRYVPDDGSVFLPSNATAPIAVRQVTASVDVDGPETTAFGDDVTVRGRVDAEGVPVSGVPVRVTVGDAVLGTVRTNDDGEYALRTTLPAGVDAGNRTLSATVALADRAVTSDTVSDTVRVASTSTRLRLNATPSGDAAEVSGRLTTAEGDVVAGRTIDVLLDGTVVATADTNAAGEFSVTVSVPDSAPPGASVTVRATFDGAGSNLDGTSATATVTLPEDDGADGDDGPDAAGTGDGASGGLLGAIVDGEAPAVIGAAVVAIAAAAAAFVVVRRRDGDSGDSTGGSPEATPTAPETATDSAAASLVERAGRHLDENPSAAVEIAFGALRASVESRFDLDPSLTHREFAAACRERGLFDGRVDDLDALTDSYERAAFGPRGVSRSTAADAVEHAQALRP
ncbi:DUF4129 domain-containing protein [Halobaculum magnesiiphilum]|uniref:DUF4129 domain-containing protein n=1 Tax=Halobaculum magnesiiphilum TaxID=1017351 RepID=A0A8T8WF93_9EURY|nr:DUF4129 domain-containing protein [Halobaculum magnesiiphilum]QZP38446.1 DUF4129 domain-containing protein [Halobaculum magnesiiphilum]